MKEVRITYSQAMKDYPDTINKMLEELKISDENSLLKDVDFFYYWTILPDTDKMSEYKHLLFFSERLEYELNKVIVEIYIRHKKYIRGEDVSDLIKAKSIREELSRIIVTSMIIEQRVFKNKEVMDSIPSNIEPIENKLFGIDIKPENLNLDFLDDYYDYEDNIDEVYTLDEILEKISKHGIESLTHNEKKILDGLSKDNNNI